MELDIEILRKHAEVVKGALAEAGRVKGYSRRSKTGKKVNVRDYERGQLSMSTVNRRKTDFLTKKAKELGVTVGALRKRVSRYKKKNKMRPITKDPKLW